jgi:hypothetical protein
MKKTATKNAVSPEITIDMEWAGRDGNKYRSFRYWMTEGWSQSFMQVNKGYGWVTAY